MPGPGNQRGYPFDVKAPSRAVVVWFGLGTLYVVWGSTYLGIKLALDGFPPFFMTGVRYTIAGTLVIAFMALRGNFRATRRQWLGTLISGGIMIPVGNGGVVWGEQYIGSGIAAIVNSTLPFWMVLLSWLLLHERLSIWTGLGLAIGFGGLVVLVGPTTVRPGELIGIFAVLVAAVGWGLGTVLTKKVVVPDNAFLVSGMQMFCGGLVASLISLLTRDAFRFNPSNLRPGAAAAFVYLIFVGGILGYGVFQWLVKNASLPLVATYAYVSPVVAVILGILVVGEHLTAHAIAGGSIVVAGVAVIVSAQAREYRRRAASMVRAASDSGKIQPVLVDR